MKLASLTGNHSNLQIYGKLAFNCNELPWNAEHTSAYFRRFLIIEFDITIPEEKQDRQLSQKIIDTELAGVFNWVIEGLRRLLQQKSFSSCDAAYKAIKQYERESNNVLLFIEEERYIKSSIKFILIRDIYQEYQIFCCKSGFKAFSTTKFGKHLEAAGYFVERKEKGKVVYLEK